jgi:hypothetical protein
MCKVNCARRRTAWPLIEPRVILRDAYASYIHRENHSLYLIHRLSIRCNLLYTTKRVPANRKKIEALRSSGALNRHPEKVRHSLFAQHDFFDPHDLVQLKYETVRAVELDGHPIAQAALDFGLSRPTIYEAQQKLRQAGVEGLLPKNAVPKKRVSLHRTFAAMLRSWLVQSPTFRPRYWSKEFKRASASCSIHALWKKQCEKKGVTDRENSAQLPTKSAVLDAPL